MKVLPRLGEENTDDNEDSLAVTVGTGSGGSGCDAAGLPWALLLLPPLLLRRRCRA
jgi:Synergist-CTERM protein sorting domain-containing protein